MGTESIISIIVVVLFAAALLTIVILEYKEECKTSKNYHIQIKEICKIHDMDEKGLCESCSYGKDRCLSECKAHCKVEEVKKSDV